MNARNVWSRQAGVVGLLALVVGTAAGQNGPIDLPPSSEPRVPVATVLEAAGLLSSEGAGHPFNRVLAKETVYSRDLLVALPGLQATLAPKSRAVTLTLWGNLPGLSDSPVLESAVILHDSRAYDLDFTLLRGRIVLTNTKKTGPAKVWLRRSNVGVELVLEEGASLTLEAYGRWPHGVPFSLKAVRDEAPTVFWQVAVVKGSVGIRAGKLSYSMSAPPGPSYFRGDSVSGPNPDGPERRDTLPNWADPKAEPSAEGKLIASLVEEYRGKLKSKDALEAGAELLAAAAKDPDKARAREVRRIYVFALGATDNLPDLLEALNNEKHEDIRKTAVVALRHWIGAAAGRDIKLYEVLLGLRYSKAEAETILQLLHSPFNAYQPEDFETLLAYLKHGRLAVRELAYWHLYRLAPAGRDIIYDAAGSTAEREKGAAAWKKLIPSGELPPKPASKKE
jgi:hypothetical protein